MRLRAEAFTLALALVAALELGSLPSSWTIRTGGIRERVRFETTVDAGTRAGTNRRGQVVTLGQDTQGFWILSRGRHVCRLYVVQKARRRLLRGVTYDFDPCCSRDHIQCVQRPRGARCSWPFRARAVRSR